MSEAASSSHPPGSARDWMRHEESGLHLAQIAFGDPDVLRNQVAFHAQQAAEKALKGVLIQHGVQFPRTHDLHALVEILRLANIPWPFPSPQIEALSVFAVETRYPGALSEVSNAEAAEALKHAVAVLEWAREEIA
jgi:HEPN domain-containing protein